MSAFSLAWLLATKGRGARGRLVGIVAGVAVGVMLLLLVIAAYDGLAARGERSNWVNPPDSGVTLDASVRLADDEVAARTAVEVFRDETITRLDLASTGHTRVSVPGIGSPPRPGEYYASPALAQLIADHPSDELGARYGELAGTISETAIASPGSLVAVVGVETASLARSGTALIVPELEGYSFPSENYQIVAVVGGIAVLFPVLVLIIIVTRLGQVARAERFATVRLIGGRPTQVAAAAVLETGAPAGLGAALGLALFWAVRPLAARVSVDGGAFYPRDLAVGLSSQILIPLATVLIACVIAYFSALLGGIGPLGAARERSERPPRLVTVLPLVLGVLVVIGTAALGVAKIPLPGYQSQVLIGGFVITLIGLVVAGPYLTHRISRIGVRRAGRASTLLAMGRIARHPRGTFRAVSGLVLALFVVTVFTAASTTEQNSALAGGDTSQRVAPDALISSLAYATPPDTAAFRDRIAGVSRIPGVARVAVVSWSSDAERYVMEEADARSLGLQMPRSADADPGAGSTHALVAVDGNYFANAEVEVLPWVEPIPEAQAADAIPSMIVVLTDGDQDSIERARTALLTSGLQLNAAPTTRAEDGAIGSFSWAARYAGLANIGVLIATAISAVTLAVSTAAGVLDRRRVFGLLRLSGMPVSVTRRMVLLETAVPLLATFALCIGLGWLTAWGVLAGLTEGRRGLALPDPSYPLTIGVALALAAGSVLIVFRTVRGDSSIGATRFE